MKKAIIYFSDKSTIEVKENDHIIPILPINGDDGIHASMGESVEVWDHIHNGLIPAIMDAFAQCDFFYLNHNYDIVYNSKSVVKIQLA